MACEVSKLEKIYFILNVGYNNILLTKKNVMIVYLDTPQTVAKATKGGDGGRIFASPYAKKLAAEMGIALDAVGTATGNKGRIVAADVIKASQEKPKASAKDDKKVAKPQPVSFVSGDRTYEDIPVSVMRDIIGKRLRLII